MESDLGKKTLDELEIDYCKSYKNFYDNIVANEVNWARAVRTVHWLDEMC